MASPAPIYASNDGAIDLIRSIAGGNLIDAHELVGEVTAAVTRDGLVETLAGLQAEGYQQLMEIAGVDYPGRPDRFDVVYHLLSVTRNHRLRIKVTTNEATPVPSVTMLWPVAGWLEREIFDMYGVLFSGNADLRRILTDYGFRGHPQRRDFPLTGDVELRWSEAEKRVVYEPVRLAQDFRSFDFTSPWEGAAYTLPGDEKAQSPQAKGAPTPLTADQIVEGDAVAAKAPPGDPKTTEHPGQTGAGKLANVQAAKTSEPPADKPKGAS